MLQPQMQMTATEDMIIRLDQPGWITLRLKRGLTQQPEHTACVDKRTVGIDVSDLSCTYWGSINTLLCKMQA